MLNIHGNNSPYYGAMSVLQSGLSDTEILHASVKNICINDGFVKSVAIFDKPPMAVIVVDRCSESRTHIFRRRSRWQSHKITLRLLKLTTKTNMCELTCSIKPLSADQTRIARQSNDDIVPENWIVAFQSMLADNISKAGARTFQTFPAT